MTYTLYYIRRECAYYLEFANVEKKYTRLLDAFKWLALVFEPGDTIRWEDNRTEI